MAKRKEVQPAALSLLCCDTMGDLDNGFARQVIDEALRRAANDIEQRGEDGKARKVNVTIELEKLDANAVAVRFAAEAKLPPFKLNPTIAVSQPQGSGECTLHFRADNAARPDQPTIPYPPEGKDGDK